MRRNTRLQEHRINQVEGGGGGNQKGQMRTQERMGVGTYFCIIFFSENVFVHFPLLDAAGGWPEGSHCFM